MKDVANLNKGIVSVCMVGVILSYYSYVIETNMEKDENYVAMCDISENMSCSKAFMSTYGKGFGIVRHILGEDSVLNKPNSIAGMIFYAIVAGLCAAKTVTSVKIQVGLCILSNIASIYLACILYFVLYNVCVLCVSTYVVNAIILVLSILKYKRIGSQHKMVYSKSPRRSRSKKN